MSITSKQLYRTNYSCIPKTLLITMVGGNSSVEESLSGITVLFVCLFVCFLLPQKAL